MAAAITAALKKFAPRYDLRVVRSLEQARETALDTPPDLLLIDFDPPLPGTLEFLEQLRSVSSETRALVITAGLPRQFLSADRFPAALTFIEKPFQLEALGACIQRLLPAVDEVGGSGSASPTLHDLSLADVIPLLGLGGKAHVVKVTETDDGLLGEVHFAAGQIQHAAASGLEGIDALREMMRWTSPNFSVTESEAELAHSIDDRWARVFDKVQRSIPHAAAPRRSPSGSSRKRKSPAKKRPPVVRDGKKVLVIDDTEPLRDFVEEMLSTADPHLQIRSAADGTEGWESCLSFRPDLILLDYSLPDFNGDEVCRRLLENETTRQIPVIMMSGHIAEMARTADTYENVVLALCKPFVSAELVDAVKRTLAAPPERKRRKTKPAVDESGRKPNGQSPVEVAPPSPPPATPPVAVPAPAATTAAAPPEMLPAPPPVSPPPPTSPAHIPVVSTPAVVLSVALEILEMSFSSTLHLTYLRARPFSRPVLLHIDPRAVSTVRLPEAAFEIDHVELDAHGQMVALRVAPTAPAGEPLPAHAGIAVDHLAIAQPNGEAEIQVTPTSGARMTIQLLAAFNLTGVELSPAFGVAHLALKMRSRRMRAVLPGPGGRPGLVVEVTAVQRDAASRLSEISLHAVAPDEGKKLATCS